VLSFNSAAGAVKALKAKFKSKAGLAFSERNSGVAQAGKYHVLQKRLDGARAGRGAVAISLMWDNRSPTKKNDLDLHVVCPSGAEIYFGNRSSACGGELDVDRMMVRVNLAADVFSF